MSEPTLVSVYREAAGLLHHYRLDEKGWRFEFDNAKLRLGQCRYKDRVISFSTYYLHSPPEEITDTLLHEIAHALVGSGHGHDYYWKQVAERIGAKPRRCGEVKTSARPRYMIKCSAACGVLEYRYRLRNIVFSYKCMKCGAPVEVYKVKQ